MFVSIGQEVKCWIRWVAACTSPGYHHDQTIWSMSNAELAIRVDACADGSGFLHGTRFQNAGRTTVIFLFINLVFETFPCSRVRVRPYNSDVVLR